MRLYGTVLYFVQCLLRAVVYVPPMYIVCLLSAPCIFGQLFNEVETYLDVLQ